MLSPPVQSLATRTVRGVFWTSSAFLLQVVTTFVFYGLLSTEQMGQFEWALVIVMFLALLCDLGLGSALVQDRDAGDEHFAAAFWLCLAFGGVTTTAVVLLVPTFADLVSPQDADGFGPILRGLVLLVPFAAVSGLFRARLQRDLRWRAMAVAEIGSSVIHAGTALSLLATGHGITSAVYSAVAREAALLLALAWTARWLPTPRFGFDALRRILAFGLNLTGSRCLNYLNSNLARVVIGFSLGMEALGFYSFAYRLTLMPLVRISTIITRVFFPTFSAICHDNDLLRRVYLRSVQAVALTYWPALAALAVLAEPVVLLAGPTMGPAVWPVRLLALATIIKAVGASVGSVFLAKGKASWALYWSMFSLVVLIPALYWGGFFGIEGVCAVLAATGALFLVLSQYLANRLMGIGFASYSAGLWRPALVALLTGAVTLAALPMLPATPVMACVVGTAVAAVAGLVGLRWIAWNDVRGMWHSARGSSADASTMSPLPKG